MHGGTSGNDETDLSRSEGASSSVDCKPYSQNVSPPFFPALKSEYNHCDVQWDLSLYKWTVLRQLPDVDAG